jgi:membrane peptidoglycan carboxypeptidase
MSAGHKIGDAGLPSPDRGPAFLREVDRSLVAFGRSAAQAVGVYPFRPWLLAAWTAASAMALVFVIATLSAAVYWYYAHDMKTPEAAIAEGFGTSVAFDRSGEHELYVYADPYGGLRDPVSLEQISPYLVAATIATEDPTFYDNPGVNFRGLARAAMENFTPFGPGLLQGSGGSSITQQLARNIYIHSDDRYDRKVTRKVKETVIALELKRNYSDDEILQWYLNAIYYGNYAYGVQTAAQSYFGKNAADLTLGEAALLAGLPQAPNSYTPAIETNREAAKQRQLEVLRLLSEHASGLKGIVEITPDQIEAAKAEPLNYVDSQFAIKAPHFVFYVEEQLRKMCSAGLFEAPNGVPCDRVVREGGLRVTTTLDLNLNALGERVIEETLAANEASSNGHNGALVATRPETGEILAYVGSRSFSRDDIQGQVDIASALRSAGSTMKPFSYLTAFEQGWAPSTHVEDKPLVLDPGQVRINNWDARYAGTVTVRKALAESINTAAVRTVVDVGIENMKATAQRMGITDLRQEDCGPSITLGSCEVKLVDMTYAYGTLATNGLMRGRPTAEGLGNGFRELDPISVLKIADSNGKVIYEYGAPEERRVVDAAHAYMMTDILSKDANKWSRLEIGRPAATKTGTSEEFRDNLVMGYTRDLALGVWMGNTDNTAMAPGTFSAAGVGPIWKAFMTEAHTYLQLPPREFERPPEVVDFKCGGKTEIMKKDQKLERPGACKPGSGPRPSPGPSAAPVETPVASVEATPEVTDRPEATEEPEGTETPEPEETPEPSDGATPEPEETPVATGPPGAGGDGGDAGG